MKQLRRNKKGEYLIKPFKDSTWSPLFFMITTVAIGAIVNWLFMPPLEPISPIGKVEAAESVLIKTNLSPTASPIPSQKAVQRRVEPVNPHRAIVERYATKYSVNPDFIDCILFRESSYRTDATNGSSTASGMGQFLLGTWKWMRGLMHDDPNPALRFDAEESIETLAWAVSKGYANHWEVVLNNSCKE